MTSLVITVVKKLSGSAFVRNVAIVATGTAGAQAITMAFAPLITRLYGPDAFGVLGTFAAILAVLTPLAAMSYPIAIVLPKRDVDAAQLAKLSMSLAVVMSTLAGLILLIFKNPIVNAFSLHAIESLLLLLPLAMLLSAILAVLHQWIVRKKHFGIKAKVAVLQSLWLNSSKAGIGLFSPVAGVLVVLTAIGSGLHALMLWKGIYKSRPTTIASSQLAKDEPSSIKALAWQHRDFAYYRTPQIVLNEASQSMPVLILVSFFGPAAAGFYAIGRMALAMPSQLIGDAVGDVFYQRISEAAHTDNKLSVLVLKATVALLAVGLIPYGSVIVFGPSMFSLIFGAEWITAGEYARWLSLWLLCMLANKPAIKALPVIDAQGFHLVFTSFTIVLRAAALVMGFMMFESAIVSVALYSVVGMLLNLTLIYIAYVRCVAYDRTKGVII